jgi:hypothetical protein
VDGTKVEREKEGDQADATNRLGSAETVAVNHLKLQFIFHGRLKLSLLEITVQG